jgi:hypothetical protein
MIKFKKVDVEKYQKGFIEIYLRNRSKFINVDPQYIDNIKRRIPNKISSKSKEKLTNVQKQSGKYSLINV